MGQEYKISAVSGDTRTYSTKFGDMISYKLKFEGESDVVELSQKTTTPAPTEGQALYGHIESTQFGKKFKKEQRQDFGGAGATPKSSASASSKASRNDDPFTMYLSYAKDIAVALVATDKGFNEDDFGMVLEAVTTGGKTLYNNRPGSDTKDTTPDFVNAGTRPTDEELEDAAKAFGGE